MKINLSLEEAAQLLAPLVPLPKGYVIVDIEAAYLQGIQITCEFKQDEPISVKSSIPGEKDETTLDSI